MTGAEDTRQFEERLARTSRAVAFWSAVGALLILSALAYSSFHLIRVQKKTQEAEAYLIAKQAELEVKQAELKELDTQLTKSRKIADAYGRTLNTLSITSPEKTAAAFKQAVRQVPIGITIQVAYKSQLAKAKEIAARLRELGYKVPSDEAIEIRGEHISDYNYVRYFFDSDKALAQQIANQIKAMGIDVKPFRLVEESDLGEVDPSNFEFRLGRKYNP